MGFGGAQVLSMLLAKFALSLRGCFAGGGPAAAHFSCLAKKSKQKKATARTLPFGFPQKRGASREARQLAFGSNIRASCSDLPLAFAAASQADLLIRGFASLALRARWNSDGLAQQNEALDIIATTPLENPTLLTPSPRASAAKPGLGNSAWTLPKNRATRRKKKRGCLSRRRVAALPASSSDFSGTPKGQRPCGRLSLLTFFGETKKVSGRRAAPGLPQRSDVMETHPHSMLER
jgi:hypothetical protein